MYFTADEIQPVVDVVTSTLGPQGIMLEGKGISRNIILGSPQFGKLWYGDVDGNLEYVENLCSILSQRTSQRITVVPESH